MILIGKDPAVDQAGQSGPRIKPVDGAAPALQPHEGSLSEPCGDDVMSDRPQAMCEPFPEVRIRADNAPIASNPLLWPPITLGIPHREVTSL
jgi:hypothetical protein